MARCRRQSKQRHRRAPGRPAPAMWKSTAHCPKSAAPMARRETSTPASHRPRQGNTNSRRRTPRTPVRPKPPARTGSARSRGSATIPAPSACRGRSDCRHAKNRRTAAGPAPPAHKRCPIASWLDRAMPAAALAGRSTTRAIGAREVPPEWLRSVGHRSATSASRRQRPFSPQGNRRFPKP